MVNLSIKDKVFELLTNFPHLRDSDEKLCANIWFSHLEHSCYNVKQFLKMYADGKLPNSDSITRCRRKIQEEHPELRGNSYSQRQAKQEKIKEELKYTSEKNNTTFGIQKTITFGI